MSRGKSDFTDMEMNQPLEKTVVQIYKSNLGAGPFRCPSCGNTTWVPILPPPNPNYKAYNCDSCKNIIEDRGSEGVFAITYKDHPEADHLRTLIDAIDNCRTDTREIMEAARASLNEPMPELKPIDMILFCPNCGLQHVDKAEVDGWQNPPHRSHLCHGCTFIWRPADAYTNGVAEIATQGKNDSPIHRGRAKSVTTEQVRIVNIINAADWAGPRLTAIRADLIRNIRLR